jgi:cyclophilin family peptidyl-prolyl cis-trans isomerase
MTYKVKGGTPFLDNNYTVFGEVETGLEVIDKIAAVEKQPGDRPIKDVRMFMEIVEPIKENKNK